MHAFDDFARTLGLLCNALHGTAQTKCQLAAGVGLGLQQIQAAVGVAGNGGQGLVQLVAEQRSHFTHRGQTGGGLQPLLAGTADFFHAAALAHVQHRAHPTRLLAQGIDEWGFKNHDRKTLAVFAHEHRLHTLTWRCIACQSPRLALTVFVHHLGRPVGRGNAFANQLVGFKAHHFAKRGVDVGDAALLVSRAQASHQRIFHGLAKGQGVGQVQLGALAASHVARQQGEHGDQSHRHGGDQGGEHIGKQVGRSTPVVNAQDHGLPRQVEQLPRREHTRCATCRAKHGQACAIGFGE